MKKKLLFPLFLLTVSVVSAQQENKIDLLAYGGIPQGQEVKVLFNEAFIVGYSEEMRNPLWVVYRAGNLKSSAGSSSPTKWERPFVFQKDRRTEAKVTHEDYIGSGYDRGHMAPNALILAQYGQMAQMETFVMSNIIAQHEDLNRRIWADLEAKVREELSQEDTRNKEVKNLYVITGPVFGDSPDTIGKEGREIPVPEFSYKIIAFRRGYGKSIKAIAFKFPQHPDTAKGFKDFIVTVDHLEEITGLNFFSELSDVKQANLESVKRDFDFNEIE